MTLRELVRSVAAHPDLGVLQSHADALAETPVSGVAYDSRSVTSNALFVGLKGQKADGALYAQEAVRRGALAVVSEDPPSGWHRRSLAAGARCAAGTRGVRRGVLRPSQRRAHARRHHRHQRQDDDLVCARRDFRSRGDQMRARRHRRLSHRRQRVRRGAHHTRGARAAADAARHGDAGMRCMRDGGVIARARSAARRPPALRRRHLHEPDPRSPRLPWRHGGLLHRKTTAVRTAAGHGGGGHQCRRPARFANRRCREAARDLRDRHAGRRLTRRR